MAIRKRTWEWKGQERTAWIVDYFDAKRVRRQKTFRTKREAQDWSHGAHVEIKQGVHVPDRDSVTIKEAGDLWIESCEDNELEAATLQLYRQHLAMHIVPFIGARRLNELTVPVLRAFQDELRGAGRSRALVAKITTYLGGLISDSQERGLATFNAVRDRKKVKKRSGKRADRHKERLKVGVHIPTPAEIRAILNAATGYKRAFFMVAALAGLRASELRGLLWADVDFAEGTITVRQRADKWCTIGSPKAASSHRTIPVPALVITALKEWKLACPRRDTGKKDANNKAIKELHYVFPNGKGNVELLANIRRRHWHPLQIAAGVSKPAMDDSGNAIVDEDGTPVMLAKYGGLHVLRHFFCSWCAAPADKGGLGLSLKETQVRMGHSTLSQTSDRYGHLFPADEEKQREALAAGERALMGA